MNFKMVADGIDTQPLLASLAEHAELWSTDTRRQDAPGSPHHATEVIHIRAPRAETPAEIFDELEAQDTLAAHLLIKALFPLMKRVLDAIGERGDIGRVMITSLPPGGQIEKHMDEGRYADHYDRFHLCLQADEDARFMCGGDIVGMQPGELWWFNHKKPHHVWNDGKRDRIHMIVDLQVPAYRALRGIYYQQEGAGRAVEEALPLFEEHYREIARYKDIPLDIDFEYYAAIEALGQLRVFSARDCGRLIGYIVYVVRRHPHYKSHVFAFQDVLFIHPDHRSSMVFPRLMKMAKERLAAEGAHVEIQHVKVYADFGGALLRMGFEKVEDLYMRRLDV
jgi:GNAT superfamily N-acetyltransferase